MDAATLASMIDQTLLKPDGRACREAAAWMEANRDQGFAALCVSPFLVPLATQHLAGSSTRVCSVVGFPLGYSLTETKAEEAVHLVELGCAEVDMVMQHRRAPRGRGRATCATTSPRSWTPSPHASDGTAIVKVILETGYLDEAHHRPRLRARRGGRRSLREDLDRVRPARRVASRDVEIMRAAVGPDIGVKAAGGIRDLDAALEMVEAGASRIGTSGGAGDRRAERCARGL